MKRSARDGKRARDLARESGEAPRARRRFAAPRPSRDATSATDLPVAAAFRIRRATIADLETVVELRLSLLREEENTRDVPLPTDIARRIHRLASTQLAWDREVTLLAVRGTECLGILRCIETAGSPLVEPLAFGYVASAYVRPGKRRHGILRALLAEADVWCRVRGLDEMRLHCSLGNRAGNAAWNALGFDATEVVRVRSVPAEPARRR